MKNISVCAALIFLTFGACVAANASNSEIIIVNKSQVERTVVLKIFETADKIQLLTIDIAPMTTFCVYDKKGEVGESKGFVFLVEKKGDKKVEAKSPSICQLVLTLGEDGKWDEVDAPVISNVGSKIHGENVKTRIFIPYFKRVELEIDPQ